MIPGEFGYERATSTVEAVQMLQDAAGEGKFLAGGHSLLPMLKLRLAEPAKLIDISRIDELRGVRMVGNRLVIGALTTHHQVATHPLVRQHLPVLADAAGQVGDLQVRNRGTIGGNLAHADMASDVPAVAMALDTELHIQTPEGEASMSAEEFFVGPLVTAMPEFGLLTTVSFMLPPTHARGVYVKFPHPASGYAVIGVAAVVGVGDDGTIDYARVGITGAADVAYRAHDVENVLLGNRPTTDLVRAAAAPAAEDGTIAGDAFASEEYRRHLCTVQTAKALHKVLT